MNNRWKTMSLFLLTLAIVALPAGVQAQPHHLAVSAQANSEKVAQGELVRVDTEAQTLTIKSPTGEEIDFQYNSDTKVEGSTSGVQGLSTKTGTRLMVHYKDQSSSKLAVRVEIVKSGTGNPR